MDSPTVVFRLSPMSENIEQDVLLEGLVRAAIVGAREHPTRALTLTVLCEGHSLTGRVITAKQFVARFRDACITTSGYPFPGAGVAQMITEEALKPARFEDAEDTEPPTHIHLACERPSEAELPKLWRIRLSKVSAFSFENFV